MKNYQLAIINAKLKQLKICNSPMAGFTLLEIIVVVFILGLLAAIVAPRIIGRTDDARIAEAKVQIKNFETAIKLFKLDSGFYPATEQGLAALVEKPTTGQDTAEIP